MLKSIRSQDICYDLIGLFAEGVVVVGRVSSSIIHLDSATVPCLVSRKHATFQLQHDGGITLTDLESVNGTYTCRARNPPLRRLPPGMAWKLKPGDIIGFGGPNIICGSKEGDQGLPNPFVFKFYPEADYPNDADYPPNQPQLDASLAGPSGQSPPEGMDGLSDTHMDVAEDQAAGLLPLYPASEIDLVSSDSEDNVGDKEHAGEGLKCPKQKGLEGTSCEARASGSNRNVEQGKSRTRRSLHRRGASDKNMAEAPEQKGAAEPQTVLPPRPGKENAMQLDVPSPPETPTGKKMTRALRNHLACPICQDWLMACHTLSCGHMFCGVCVASWLKQKQSCPTCRSAVAGVPVRCFQVDAAINELLGATTLSPSAKQERATKQARWANMQYDTVHNWASDLQSRKLKAQFAAGRSSSRMLEGALP